MTGKPRTTPLGALAVGWGVLLASAAVGPTASAAPTNVLLIIADDQGWGDYGFMGHPQLETPRLDRLAAESLVFEQGHVPTSLCRASLASIITGLYPHQHGITSNDPPLPEGKAGRAAATDPQVVELRRRMAAYIERAATLPRLLAASGYVSLQTGKWWESEACRCGGFTEGMTHGDPARGGRHGDAGLAIGRQGIEPVARFIDQAQADGQPFFVWYAPLLPHQPHHPPPRLLEKYLARTESSAVARYWAMCEWFDETCGALVDHLETRGLAADTLVVYVCDNGWIQDPARDTFAPRSKRSPYEGGLRTPILLRQPGAIARGRVPTPVSSLDLAVTILRACGQRPPDAMPGVDLTDPQAVAGRQAIFGATFTHNAIDIDDPRANVEYRWVIADGWKLIDPAPRLRGVAAELFRVAEDPQETDDRAAAESARVAELRARLDAWWPLD